MYAGTLTADDLALVASEQARWMAAGLSTERCDRPEVERLVGEVYEAAGLAKPLLVVWMDSPLGGAFAAGAVRQLWGQLGGQLGGQLWGQLGGQLGDQLRGQLRGQLGMELSPWWDAYWLALYRCAFPIADLPASERLESLAEAQAACGWWWPQRGAVILTDRPTRLCRDGQGRLHATDGPALAYGDGYSLWAVGGVRVPADVVERPECITTDRIWAEGNAEVRRVMIDQLGWDRFVGLAGLSAVDEADDPGNPGQRIALYDLPEAVYDEPVRVLLCTNGSPERDGVRRRFGLTVPADVQTAVAAAAWTYDLTPDAYAGLVRRT